MKLLLPGNAKSLLNALGDDGTHYGWLLTPSRTMTESNTAGWRYGIDNECFTRPFDGARYERAINRTWAQRVNGSNILSAAVDSIVFPTLAFGAFMPAIVAGQFIAKVVGGAVWSMIIAEAEALKEQEA